MFRVNTSIKILTAYIITNKINLDCQIHSHDFYQFLYVFNGRCEITLEKNSVFVLKPNQFVIFCPGTSHKLKYPKPDKVSCTVFYLKFFISYPMISDNKFPWVVDISFLKNKIESTIKLICTVFTDDFKNRELALDGLMRYLFFLLETCNNLKNNPSLETKDDRIIDICQYINSRIPGRITVAELSEKLSLNKQYFTRLFHSNTGISPIEYIVSKKLEYSKNMLVFSSLKLKEIANLSGYNHYHLFSNQFKKKFGLNPKEYRKTSEPFSR